MFPAIFIHSLLKLRCDMQEINGASYDALGRQLA